MERVPPVWEGFWVNHDRTILKKLQFTTSERGNLIVPVATGVLLGATLIPLSNILARSYEWVVYFYHRRQNNNGDSNAHPAPTLINAADAHDGAERRDRFRDSALNWVGDLGGASQVADTEHTTDGPTPPYGLEDANAARTASGTQSDPANVTAREPPLNSDERTPLLNDGQRLNPLHGAHANRSRSQLDADLNSRRLAPPSGPPATATDSQNILPTDDPIQPDPSGRANIAMESILQNASHGSPESVINELSSASDDDSKKNSSNGWQFKVASGTFLLAYGIFVVAASFSATTRIDSSGLSASKYCGSWSLKANAGKEAMDSDDQFQAQKEMRAGQYGRDCYGHRWVTSPDQCKFFDSPVIPYEVLKEQDCPFSNEHLCHGGKVSAVRFSTGLLDASVLGINAEKSPKFNRTTVCVPLNLDQGFVKEIPPDVHHHDYRYEYHLGPVNGSQHSANYTYRTLGDPFKWDVPAYSMSVYQNTPESHYWSPSEELEIMQPGRHSLTLLFISICRIIFSGQSDDYIFHANQPYRKGKDRYYSADPRARILACVDWNELCSPDGRKCAPMDGEHGEYGPEYEFMRTALKKSNTFHAIQFRLGNGLVAQESVADYESPPLDPKQWIIESEALYRTSLARAQFDAFDIATGFGHEKGLGRGPYELDTPDWAKDRMCDKYKFQLPRGYTNISVVTAVCVFAIVPFLLGLAYERSAKFDEERKSFFLGKWMVFDSLIWVVFHPREYIQSVRETASAPRDVLARAASQSGNPRTRDDL